MEIVYGYSASTVKPEELETTKSTVYLRKDITSKVEKSEDGTETTWCEYKEATLTPAEFAEYQKLLAVQNATDIVTLKSGQETGDANQLAIMEAIADLYEAVATIGA